MLQHVATRCRHGCGFDGRAAHRLSNCPQKPDNLLAALACADRFRLQYLDALIAIVSRAAGATLLLSEDMQDGLDMEGLVVANPFIPANADRIAAGWQRR
jgi:predicted nucleic acid-binding protein